MSKVIASGNIGMPVSVGVGVIVGVREIVGVGVIVAVLVTVIVSVVVGLGVIDGVGGIIRYAIRRPEDSDMKAAIPKISPRMSQRQPINIRSRRSRKYGNLLADEI
jgi:hypothetical protein